MVAPVLKQLFGLLYWSTPLLYAMKLHASKDLDNKPYDLLSCAPLQHCGTIPPRVEPLTDPISDDQTQSESYTAKVLATIAKSCTYLTKWISS